MSSVVILIVDDQARFRRTVRSLIESQPECCVCGEAGDVIEAVEGVHQLHPDLVLMDINMPRMDGLEATRIIRRESPDCNVVIVTQNDAPVARKQARSVDANGFVTKSDLIRDLLRRWGGWEWKTIAAWTRQKAQRPTVSPGAVF